MKAFPPFLKHVITPSSASPRMIARKRRQGSSAVVSTASSYGKGSPNPSVAPSSPVPRRRLPKHAQQQPRKRRALHLSSSRLGLVSSSSPSCAARQHTHQASTTSSAQDLHPEDKVWVGDGEEGDSLDEVIMAVEMRDRGVVGCSYYLPREQTLFMVCMGETPGKAR